MASCRLSATSPKLLAFIFFSQSITIGANVRIVLARLDGYPLPTSLVKILFTLYDTVQEPIFVQISEGKVFLC